SKGDRLDKLPCAQLGLARLQRGDDGSNALLNSWQRRVISEQSDKRRFVNRQTCQQVRSRRSEPEGNDCAERVADNVRGREVVGRNQCSEVGDIFFDAALRSDPFTLAVAAPIVGQYAKRA